MIMANRLKQLRVEASLSQMKLAMEFQLTTATISKYELGTVTPDAEKIRMYSHFFNVSADYILGLTDMRNGTVETKEHNSEELELLELFKQLPDKYKYEVRGYIKGIISSNT